MGRIGKSFALILILIMAISCLIMVESAFAQTIPKPSVPEFTLKYIHNSYDVAPTYGIDPYTGKTVVTQAGYHVENQSVEIAIRNQPFTYIELDNGRYANLFYNISYRGHYEKDWYYYSYDLNTEWFLGKSDSEYTVISFKQIPNEGKMDFRVQAQVGYFTDYNMPWKVYVFHGETSGWSNIQTITIPEGSTSTSPNPTPTPTVPEFPSMIIILTFLITVTVLWTIIVRRKIKKLTK
jgi:hypothetical protein